MQFLFFTKRAVYSLASYTLLFINSLYFPLCFSLLHFITPWLLHFVSRVFANDSTRKYTRPTWYNTKCLYLCIYLFICVFIDLCIYSLLYQYKLFLI